MDFCVEANLYRNFILYNILFYLIFYFCLVSDDIDIKKRERERERERGRERES